MDARALHGQVAMYVLMPYTGMIWPCLFYVHVNIINIQMKFYNHDYIVVNGSVLLIVNGCLACFDGKH